jgi:hypothetical protein
MSAATHRHLSRGSRSAEPDPEGTLQAANLVPPRVDSGNGRAVVAEGPHRAMLLGCRCDAHLSARLGCRVSPSAGAGSPSAAVDLSSAQGDDDERLESCRAVGIWARAAIERNKAACRCAACSLWQCRFTAVAFEKIRKVMQTEKTVDSAGNPRRGVRRHSFPNSTCRVGT